MTESQRHTNENVQKAVQDNVSQFKAAYNELLAEVVNRRKAAGLSQEAIAECLKVDRRKIIAVEAGEVKVGILLRYADLLDVETKLKFTGY